jgi:hypothetical protein
MVGRMRAISGAFHDYVRGVFAERSTRAPLVRASRARWLAGLGQHEILGRSENLLSPARKPNSRACRGRPPKGV